MKEHKLKNWLELEKKRVEWGICGSCFKKTLEIILSKKELIEIKKIK